MSDESLIDQLVRELEDPAKAELLIQIVNQTIIAQQQSQIATFNAQQIQQRWEYQGEPIVTDGNGDERDVTGNSYFDRINLLTGSATVNAENPRQLDLIVGGGGADCMFNYLVSECWADEVAAGRGVEGQVMTSLTGCTFKVYSEVQGAIDDWEAAVTGAVVMFICGGTYNESVTITNSTHEIHLYGSGADRTIIGGSAGNFAAAGSIECFMHNMTLDGPSGGYSMTNAFASNMHMRCYNVIFRKKMGGDHSRSEFYDCGWEGGLSFNSSIDEPEHVRIYGGYVSTVGIDFSTANGVTGWHVRGLLFLATTCVLTYGDSVANTDLEIAFATGGGTLSSAVVFKTGGAYAGNKLKAMFRGPVDTATIINVETGASVYNFQLHAEFDAPSAAPTATTNYIRTTGTGFFYGSEFIVTFRRNGAGLFLEDLGAHQSISGDFRRCAFVITPTNAEVTLSGSSVGNVFLGGIIVSAPSGGVAYPHRIQDADNDTYWDVEETADVDEIHGGRAGSEVFVIDATGMTYKAVPRYLFDATAGNFGIFAAAADANAVFNLNAGLGALVFGAGGASAFDIGLVRRSGDVLQVMSTSAGAVRDFAARQIHVGSAATAMTNAEASIELVNTNHAALLNVLTTSQQNGVTAVDGMICYNSTNNLYTFHEASVWHPIVGYLGAPHALTIASGAVTIPSGATTGASAYTLTLAGEGGVDDVLATVNGLVAGRAYLLRPASGSVTITLDHAAGNILCVNNADIVLDDVHDFAWGFSPDGTSLYVFSDTQGAGGTNALLDASNHTDTTASSVTRGDLIIGNATPAWDDLAIGAANTFLKSDGTDPSWAAVTAAVVSAADAGGHYTGTDVEAQLQEVAVEARADFKSITITNPTVQNIRFLIAPYAFTITEVKTNIVGGTSVTFNIEHGTNPTSGTANLWSSDEVANTLTAAELQSTSYNDASVADEEVISIDISAVSGSVTQFMVTVYFTRD